MRSGVIDAGDVSNERLTVLPTSKAFVQPSPLAFTVHPERKPEGLKSKGRLSHCQCQGKRLK
jgi:hypothetical protein